jgi:hypothetical protein
MSDGEATSDDPPVLLLACAHCDASLCARAVSVFLCAEPASVLFSTDIPQTDAVREGGQILIPTCDCGADAVHCRACDAEVGYHVLHPCATCSEYEHNDMYWLFNANDVRSQPRGLRWSQLPYNGRMVDSVDEPAAADAEPCCICARPMWRRTRVRTCGHEFCFGCISREVDARQQCPLDRQPVTRAMLAEVTPSDAESATLRCQLTDK